MTLAEYAAKWVDMAPHYPTLVRYAAEAHTVVEFGVRGGVSTWALLTGMPADAVLWSVDIEDVLSWVPEEVRSDPRWHFIVGDDLSAGVQTQLPAAADLVFIDTNHEYGQTKAEIAYALTFSPARIIFHDHNIEGVGRAVTEWTADGSWHVVSIEEPYGLAVVEPGP